MVKGDRGVARWAKPGGFGEFRLALPQLPRPVGGELHFKHETGALSKR